MSAPGRSEVWNVRGTNYTVAFSRVGIGHPWQADCPELRLSATGVLHATARTRLREKMMSATARRPKDEKEGASHMTLEYHPLANLFPLIEGEEFAALVADMKENGFRSGEEIVLYEGKILDGRNRYRAGVAAGVLEAAGTGWHFVQFDSDGIDGCFNDAEIQAGPLAYVLAKNMNRRHLNESQRAMVAARIATLKQGEQAERRAAQIAGEILGGGEARESAFAKKTAAKVTQGDAAKKLSVSERSVRTARAVQDTGTPELIAAVESGRMAVSLAAQAAKLSPAQQQAVLTVVAEGKGNAVRTVVKREARAAKEKTLGEKQCAFPDKKYGVILADPEWRFEPYSRDTGLDRAPDNHYPTSDLVEIRERDVESFAAKDCVLFLWAPAPMLPDAILTMKHWGFEYRSHVVWVKKRKGNARGTGYWFTGEHELLLVGVRGSVPAPAPGKQFTSVIHADVGKHSEKPEAFRRMIETYFPNLPKIELNARSRRAGWDAWGNEAPERAFEEKNEATDEAAEADPPPAAKETKRCAKCRKTKPASAFSSRGGARKDELHPRCKQCRAAHSQDVRAKAKKKGRGK